MPLTLQTRFDTIILSMIGLLCRVGNPVGRVQTSLHGEGRVLNSPAQLVTHTDVKLLHQIMFGRKKL